MLLPKETNNYVLLALVIPVQVLGLGGGLQGNMDAIKAKASNMDTLIAIVTSTAFLYSAVVTISSWPIPI